VLVKADDLLVVAIVQFRQLRHSFADPAQFVKETLLGTIAVAQAMQAFAEGLMNGGGLADTLAASATVAGFLMFRDTTGPKSLPFVDFLACVAEACQVRPIRVSSCSSFDFPRTEMLTTVGVTRLSIGASDGLTDCRCSFCLAAIENLRRIQLCGGSTRSGRRFLSKSGWTSSRPGPARARGRARAFDQTLSDNPIGDSHGTGKNASKAIALACTLSG